MSWTKLPFSLTATNVAPCKWFSMSDVYFFKIASMSFIFDSMFEIGWAGGISWRARKARDEKVVKIFCVKSKIENILEVIWCGTTYLAIYYAFGRWHLIIRTEIAWVDVQRCAIRNQGFFRLLSAVSQWDSRLATRKSGVNVAHPGCNEEHKLAWLRASVTCFL